MLLQDLLNIELPLIQAPMAGAQNHELTVAVANAGALGSLPAAMLSVEALKEELLSIKSLTSKPFNVNFFCHTEPSDNAENIKIWRQLLEPFYREFEIEVLDLLPTQLRKPFDSSAVEIIEYTKPPVVSFHFGLPDKSLLDRVKTSGAKILSTATTLNEALWLQEKGVDAVVAQGLEAGGHRGHFLSDDLSLQLNTLSLVKQLVSTLDVPVIAAGGIYDSEAVKNFMSLGAAGVQVGTAYLLCPEMKITDIHRAALVSKEHRETTLTNLFSGRPARGIINRIMKELGPLNAQAPEFPLAGNALVPLRKAAEKQNLDDFSSLWCGTEYRFCKHLSAAEITRKLCEF